MHNTADAVCSKLLYEYEPTSGVSSLCPATRLAVDECHLDLSQDDPNLDGAKTHPVSDKQSVKKPYRARRICTVLLMYRGIWLKPL